MPASRLSAGQRAEMVERFRQGVATVVLANAYGCSPNTVSRLVKAALDGAEYERLKRQRQRGMVGADSSETDSGETDSGGADSEQPLDLAVSPLAPTAADHDLAASSPATAAETALPALSPPPQPAVELDLAGSPPSLDGEAELEAERDAEVDAAAELAVTELAAAELAVVGLAADAVPAADPVPAAAALEQPRQASLPGLLEASLASPPQEGGSPADEAPVGRAQPLAEPPSVQPVSAPAASVASAAGRGAPQQGFLDEPEEEPGVLAIEDAEDFGDEDDDDLGEDDPDDGEDALAQAGVFLAIAPLEVGLEPSPVGAVAWGSASLPSSAYMLVEKSVELQPQVLRELPELGLLSEEEQQRQALVLYVNPRQAKRLCGRNQRVIRIPDTQVFELTASKLAAQGITRVVVEGSLFALPGC